MYSRDEIKALTDKVLNMAKADAVEVYFDGGERSATRWANSSITVNLVQYDQQLTLNVRHGQNRAPPSTREFDDESLKAMVDEANEAAQKARDNPNLTPLVKGPQDYVPVDAVVAEPPRTSVRASARRGSSSRSTSARRKACSAPATSRRPTRPPASRIPKGCSRTTSTRKPASC